MAHKTASVAFLDPSRWCALSTCGIVARRARSARCQYPFGQSAHDTFKMKFLELKIPPPLVALTFALAMWFVSRSTPSIDIGIWVRAVVAVAVALLGGAISLAGVLAFRRARTTVNPMKPQSTSMLVTGGIYRFTRNPMYVGLLLVLVAWATFLSSLWTLVGPLAFVLYITRFQIKPEESALATLFGQPYADYRAKVRRWF